MQYINRRDVCKMIVLRVTLYPSHRQAVDKMECPYRKYDVKDWKVKPNECKGGNTMTGAGLDHALDTMMTPECGARPDASKVVFVLTDGASTEKRYWKHRGR